MNRLQSRAAHLRSDDSGTALVLALLVVLLVGALLAAVLDFTRTGFGVALGVRADRNDSNYAQGAVEGAINEIRGSSISGRQGMPCPDFAPPVTGTDVASTFTVSCEGQAVPLTSPDGLGQPDFAIHQLSAAPLGVHQVGNNELTVDGGVYAQGDISVSAGLGNDTPRMTVLGSALARGTCPTGTPVRLVTTDNGAKCPGYSGPAAVGADPLWPSAVPSQSALQTMTSAPAAADPIPACNGAGTIVFGPGYYGETPDRLVKRYRPTCTGAVMHFTPGFYYFDYPGTWDLETPAHLSGPNVPPLKVVGGTAGSGLTSRVMGTGCRAAATDDGVQFVFGGSSRLRVAGNNSNTPQGIELCGPTAAQNDTYSPGFRQRVALYGATAGQPTHITGQSAGSPTNETTVTEAGAAALGTTPGALAPGGTAAVLTSSGGARVTTTLRDFSLAPALPNGARVQRIRVRVTQRPLTATDNPLVNSVPSSTTVALTAGSTTYPTSPVSVPTNCPASTPACWVDVVPAPANAPFWRDLAGMTLQYQFRGPNGANNVAGVLLDGFEVEVQWTRPTLRPLTCGASGCFSVETGSNPRVHLHGSVYLPSVGMQVRVHNGGDTVFARGVVVGTLDVDVSASTKQLNAPFQLPNATPGGRVVLFKARDASGQLRVRACAVYDDKAPKVGSPGFLGYPGWNVSVPKWFALRDGVDGNSCAGVLPAP